MSKPFKPAQGSTISLSCSTTTTSATAVTGAPGGMEYQVRLYNAGSATVFLARGGSSVAATTANLPIPSGAVEVLTFEASVTHVAAITATGTATLYITTGAGI